MQLQHWKDELDRMVCKIDRMMPLYGTQFPWISESGNYSEQLSDDGNWTGSFWTGMVALAYQYTGHRKYIDYLESYSLVYENRVREGYLDHDTGFLYQLYAVALYKATGNESAKRLALAAADKLLARFNEKGGFIRAWGRLEEDERRGKMIIDCLMNLPLLWSASALSGDPTYAIAADRHAASALKYHIREDGSTHHTFDFDPDTGMPIGGYNEGGYSDDSAWSRGQSWGIYGFALAYRHTGKREYADAARKLTTYFLDRLPTDLVPLWDFKLPDGEERLRDASASAIALCGILELCRLLPEQVEPWAGFRAQALDILESLRRRYSAASEPALEGTLRSCFGRVKGVNYELFSIWGDYYYMEGLMMAAGKWPNAWQAEANRETALSNSVDRTIMREN